MEPLEVRVHAFALLFTLLLSACGEGEREPAPQVPGDLPDAGQTTTVAPLEDGWCAHLAGGPSEETDLLLGLSALHAHARYFAPEGSARIVDDALVQALRTESEPGGATLIAYARALESVCVTANDERPLSQATVRMQGTTAYVRPGIGSPVLPAEAEAIVLDFRDLPDAPGIAEAVDNAVASVLAAPLDSRRQRVVLRTGLTDEVNSRQSLYTANVGEVERAPVSPRASSALPLAVLTGTKLPPIAAEYAFALRLSGRAFVFGAPVRAEVAEARKSGSIAGASYFVRDTDLLGNEGRFPDVLVPDAERVPDDFASPGAPPEVASLESGRAEISLRDDFGDTREKTLDVASLRAALLSAHGAARLFFPYFELLEADFDARLKETFALAADAAADRDAARDVLRRLSNALQDGHGWVFDHHAPYGGLLPLSFEEVEDQIVISRSATPLARRGDLVTSIDGVDSAAWLQRQMSLTYGATDGHRFFTAMSELAYPPAPVSFGIRHEDGSEEVVTPPLHAGVGAVPMPYAASTRGHGWLSDFGAADLYYLNIDGQFAGSDAEINARLQEAQSARGLILDLRGHPAGTSPWNPYAFLQRIIPYAFASPRYSVKVYTGPDQLSELRPYEATYPPLTSPSFSGPIALILDGRAVSFSEDFAMMLVGAGRARVVGRPSSGTTGSVTGMMLPGGFSFHLTSMSARWPDGSTFFGIGALPDVPVEPTLAEYLADSDPFISAAIESFAE